MSSSCAVYNDQFTPGVHQDAQALAELKIRYNKIKAAEIKEKIETDTLGTRKCVQPESPLDAP